jgi:hypothetical protein
MPELVMTSWIGRGLLGLLISSAALSGSARPVESLSHFVRTPEAPALIFPDGYPPRLFAPFFLIG